jgi:hypothetical protein
MKTAVFAASTAIIAGVFVLTGFQAAAPAKMSSPDSAALCRTICVRASPVRSSAAP